MGSGRARALIKFARDFPKTVFIGVDTRYGGDKCQRVDVHRVGGIQLVNDNWLTLAKIPSGSADTVISHCGCFTHGLSIQDLDQSRQIIESVSRITKTGAILRYNDDGNGSEKDMAKVKWIRELLVEDGWKVFPKGETRTIIAIKN